MKQSGNIVNLSKDGKPAQDVVSHEVHPTEVATDHTSYARLGWLVVLVGVVGFFLWAFLAPLDKGVPVSGTVIVSGNRKAIQHQSGGIVQEILVKEGDIVTAGQVLVRMNDVLVKSAADISRIQYFNDRAIEARLIAERDGKSIVFPAELLKEKSDPRSANNMSLQQQLFVSRQAALRSELAGLDQSIAGLKIQTQGLRGSMESKKEQLVFLKEQLVGMRDLAKDGYIARNRLLDLERTYIQTSGAISEDIGNIGRAQSQYIELGLRRSQRQQEYQKEVRSQLVDVQKEAEALQSRLTSQNFELANAEVKAPVAGTVVGLNVFTNGGVVGPGFRMMDIVPNDEPLIVEGQIPVDLIDKVRVDLPVEMIFSALNQSKTPHVPGIVTQVSADRLTDERTGMPYYKLKAKVAPSGAKIIASVQIRPGMPVEIFVRTGERSMMSYLMKPLFDRAKTSLSEE
ncbi:MAG: HlyD family type I secretion periplasmic adaptor subunit [Glaciimonas sp.]|nr:HlyD family type I secretion periplasmic adaptor subunit [Glaciimonas sp.]